MGVVGFLVIAALVVLLLSGVVTGRRQDRSSLHSDPGLTVRLARMENTLQLLESRLDSLEEQQRFLERLLRDRPDPPALPGPSRPDPPSEEPSPSDPAEPGQAGETSILFDVDAAEPDDPSSGTEDPR